MACIGIILPLTLPNELTTEKTRTESQKVIKTIHFEAVRISEKYLPDSLKVTGFKLTFFQKGSVI
jgi:hypothetical protein